MYSIFINMCMKLRMGKIWNAYITKQKCIIKGTKHKPQNQYVLFSRDKGKPTAKEARSCV